jgi:hypothetical protein
MMQIGTTIQQHRQIFYLTTVAIHLPLVQTVCFNVQLAKC